MVMATFAYFYNGKTILFKLFYHFNTCHIANLPNKSITRNLRVVKFAMGTDRYFLAVIVTPR
jgi:hypothetical protein